MGARDLLYFNPDPEVPDADLFGIGDLIYSDGSTQYVNDPELVAGLPPIPPGMSPQGSIGMGPPQAQPEMGPPQAPAPIPIETEQGPMQLEMNGNISPMQPEQSFGAGTRPLTDLFAGGPDGAAFAPQGGDPTMSPMQQQRQPGAPQAPPPVTIMGDTGEPFTIDPTGNVKPGAGGVPIEQLQQQMSGMQPVQREGALPPDVAARQAQEMGAMNAQTLAVTEQTRRDESRLMNELTLKQMAANEAERLKREQELADNQARSERLRTEMQAVNDVQIEQDIISARGPVGGFLAVIGAVLQGAAGNDAGFRMIDRQIDRYTQDQVRIKGTKLNMLAEQLGSTQQAITAGKAALYKVGADKLELLAQKVKGDVYEAQSPAVIQALRQKQLEASQKFEQESLGKTLEKVPLPPKPPSPEMLKAYGELRRSRDSATGMVKRVEQQVGLLWEPGRDGVPGHYQNRDEILKRGIEGIGALEQWVPDAFYSTLGMQEGAQVRGAAQALAYAQIRQMQPTGPISNADIQAAVKAGALETEEGMLRGLERMRQGEEQQMTNDAGQYGVDVVQQFEQIHRASGGIPDRAPAASRPATYQDVPRRAAPQASNPVSLDDPEERRGMLAESLTALSQEKGLPPEAVDILMAQSAHETADFKRMPANNFFGMKASGRNRSAGAGSANLETTEGQGSGAQRVRQNFATFNTPADAAADMLSLLERKYPRAVEALEVGDVDAYVAALAQGGYFTGSEDSYRSGILRRL